MDSFEGLIDLLLSGCLWYVYPADPAAELLLHESFEDPYLQDTWYVGTAPGYPEDASVINGRWEVFGPRHFLQTEDRYPLDLTILVGWSVTNGDVTSQIYPEPNVNDVDSTVTPDFTVTIDGIDLTVELYLYGFDPDSTRMDTVRIINIHGVTIFINHGLFEFIPATQAGF